VVGPDGQVGRGAVWSVSVCRVGRVMVGWSADPFYIKGRPTNHPILPALKDLTDDGWSADGRPTFWPTIDHPSAGRPPAGGRARPQRACREGQAGPVGVRRPATRRFENRPRLGFQPPCDRGRTRHGHPSPGVVSNSCRRALQASQPPEAAHTPPEPSGGLHARSVGLQWPSPWPWNRNGGIG
jgi:hypothetical protein